MNYLLCHCIQFCLQKIIQNFSFLSGFILNFSYRTRADANVSEGAYEIRILQFIS